MSSRYLDLGPLQGYTITAGPQREPSLRGALAQLLLALDADDRDAALRVLGARNEEGETVAEELAGAFLRLRQDLEGYSETDQALDREGYRWLEEHITDCLAREEVAHGHPTQVGAGFDRRVWEFDDGAVLAFERCDRSSILWRDCSQDALDRMRSKEEAEDAKTEAALEAEALEQAQRAAENTIALAQAELDATQVGLAVGGLSTEHRDYDLWLAMGEAPVVALRDPAQCCVCGVLMGEGRLVQSLVRPGLDCVAHQECVAKHLAEFKRQERKHPSDYEAKGCKHCDRPATWALGAKNPVLVCDEHEGLPAHKKKRHRVRLDSVA